MNLLCHQTAQNRNMDADNNFYDELSSFMPSQDEYGLNTNDLDEIIGSTVSNLDSSFDLNTFIPPALPAQQSQPLQEDFIFSDLCQPSQQSENNYDFNFSTFSAFSTPSPSTERTASATSADVTDCFDELMNFLNEDNVKIDGLTRNNLLEHTRTRNTPSPTGSCSSSGGSSTSGIHSDTSDTSSRSSALQTTVSDNIDVESATISSQASYIHTDNEETSFALKHEDINVNSVLQPRFIPMISVPTIQQQSQSQINVELLPGKLVPVQAIPTTIMSSVPVNAQTKQQIQLQPHQNILKIAQTAPKLITATAASSKPKTILLSSNDFKTLMQKMNSNTKSTKINGSVKVQIPKIVVKPTNGKFIAGSKIVQPDAPKFLKPQQFNRAASNETTCTTATESVRHGFKGVVDERMYKKQQRMIKNRESASLSRKKKKEYVVSLESRINKLEQENYTLRGENGTLRNQLVAFAKTCKCRNGNVSEFVLNSLGSDGKGGQQHVKMSPRPSFKGQGLKQRMTAATVKKNVAVLFAMAFMVTLNAGNFQSYLNKHNTEGDGAVLDSIADEPMKTGRRLLWVDTEEEYSEKLSRSKRQLEEMAVPPLHFLRPANRSGNATDIGVGNATAEPPPLAYTVPQKCVGACATSFVNQSEYSRLARNLHKWIDGNDYLNLSLHTKFENELDNPHGFKLTTDFLDMKPGMERQITHPAKRKIFMTHDDIDAKDRLKKHKMDPRVNSNKKGDVPSNSDQNPLKVYKQKIDEEYLRLFKGIKRQDDRFYVLSFNLEHILLPASAYNKSARPKMSLLLPTGDPKSNGDIVLMQIDCEVFNTTQLELKSHMIPSKLRPNITKWQAPVSKPSEVVNNKANYGGSAVRARDNSPQQYERPTIKEKPRVSTYFMLGPKNEAAAAASSEKPRLVKFNNSSDYNELTTLH